MGKTTEAKGEIIWVEELLVGYKCECGAELVIDEEMNNDPDRNVCHRCNRHYKLVQTNSVYEVKR